ncbi:MAG: hypothetical protein L3J95_00715 [Thermoplasmata archaeon]|nr:hypothetical protein [Thermoplasmata archaeon]MCI4358941.1 hypothetical protein [Thermoplasmata archaeon]
MPSSFDGERSTYLPVIALLVVVVTTLSTAPIGSVEHLLSGAPSEPAVVLHDGIGPVRTPGNGAAVETTSHSAPPLPCSPGPSGRYGLRACPVTTRAVPASSGGSNSTPVSERGSPAGQVNVGQDPVGVGVDPTNGWVYVANFGGGTVTVLNGSATLATISLGSSTCGPFGVAYDPANGYVYVTESAASSVAVLQGTQLLRTLVVQASPEGIAVDPGTGLAYVAQAATNNVTILNGTTVGTTVPAGVNPDGVAYSSWNGDMYIADFGENNVTVLNGTTRAAHIAVGTNPSGIAFDPITGYTFVSDSGSSEVSVLYGLNFIRNIAVQSGPDGIVVDGPNGLAYVANQGSDSVSVLNATTALTTIGVGTYPEGDAFDPQNGVVYVADASANIVTEISTELGIAAPLVVNQGVPVSATDAGQTLTITSVLWATGAGADTATTHISPSPGFGCASGPTLTNLGTASTVAIACTPTGPGVYNIWLNVSDTLGSKVWSTVTVPVSPTLNAPSPTFTGIYLAGVAVTDVNQTIGLVETATGGSGVFVGYTWVGVTTSICQLLNTARPNCRFPSVGVYSISVRVNDSNQASVASDASPLHVDALPSAPLPTSNHTSGDVGESVRFFEAASGGTGTYSYQWLGFNGGSCTSQNIATPACSFGSPGVYSLSVGVTDQVGALSVSPSLSFHVLALPVVTAPSGNRSFLDVGQSLALTTSASGGFGNYSYAWQGLPTSCQKSNTTHPVCTATSPGNWIIWPEVIDGNGGIAQSGSTLSIPIYPDPSVAAPALSSATIGLGGQVTFSADPTGGSGGYSYNWSGLPPGCAGRSATIRCTPSATGTFAVAVSVRDSSGVTARSMGANLTVSSTSILPQWLPLSLFLVFVGVAALVMVLVALIVVRRRRRRASPEEVMDPPVPPTTD